MKKISIILLFIFTTQVFADCRQAYEDAFIHRLETSQRITNVGRISTATSFVVVGGFYGYMGVVLLGPLWAGAITGATFGVAAALPVGTTFFIINKIQKARIRKLGRMISVMQGGEEFDILLDQLKMYYPDLTASELSLLVENENQNESLCDGRIARFGQFASVKDLKRFLIKRMNQVVLN
jgi:hypothetical protein